MKSLRNRHTAHVALQPTFRPVNPEPMSRGLKFGFGLLAGLWLTAATAQPEYTPITLDDPTPQADAEFGSALAGVGDVNSDGTPDLLVGAPNQDVSGNFDQGQAFVLSGADGSRLLTLDNPTPQEFAYFGNAVAGAGDVNGDGTPDLLVGASGQVVSDNFDQGQAFVLSGADGSHLLTLDDPTPQAGAGFGTTVAVAGDVNGDGVPDLLVGAPSQQVGGNRDQGQAFVLSGADGSHLLTLDDPTPHALAGFGYAVAGAGDVNGDGTPDLLVGASGNVGGNVGQGQAFVLSGANGSHLLTLDDPTPQVGAGFGTTVAVAGDVNGDGVPDLLVGAPSQQVGGNRDQGQAFVLSGADGSRLLTLDDPNPQVGDPFFGSDVAGVGDINGDGTPDLLVGAPAQSVSSSSFQGEAYVLNGANGNVLVTLDVPTLPQVFARFGLAVAGVGDINSDGTPDLLVGAPYLDVGSNPDQGQVVLFVSKATTTSFTIFTSQVELQRRRIELSTTFKLGVASNGIDPVTEGLMLKLDSFVLTIPPNAFYINRHGTYLFKGRVDGAQAEAQIRLLKDGRYRLKLEASHVDLPDLANPVTVTLTIGDDTGTTTIHAKIKHHRKQGKNHQKAGPPCKTRRYNQCSRTRRK
jgi:hypothetical protein